MCDVNDQQCVCVSYPQGRLRYANNSNYKNDVMIRKEVTVSQVVMDELKRIIGDSEVSEGGRPARAMDSSGLVGDLASF